MIRTMGMDAVALLDRVDDLPPLPAVATRVMTIVDDENASATDLANVLAADQALTAKLIRLSNSAYYGFGRKVSSVRDAITVLGFNQVRDIAVSMSVMHAFSRPAPTDDGFDLDLFWGHSVAIAVAGESVSRRMRAAKPQDAFTAGILHDIGRLVLRMTMPVPFADALAYTRETGTPLHLSEVEATGYDHAEIGRALGERWSFPQHLIEAVWSHHDESLTPQVDGLPGVVAQCNRLALHYGLCCGFDIDAPTEPLPVPPDLAEVEAAAGGIDHVLDRAFAFIEAASGTPQNWYQPSGNEASLTA